jgi:hypothetical protein
MRSRTLFTAALLTLTLAVGACTGDGPASTTPRTTPGETGSEIPQGSVAFVPGMYHLELSGVTVRLDWQGAEATMTVENGSGVELGQAAVTAITNEPVTVEATVEGPAAIAVGETASFRLSFGDLAEPDAGLLLLSFGGDSWGALSPVVA